MHFAIGFVLGLVVAVLYTRYSKAKIVTDVEAQLVGLEQRIVAKIEKLR